jgi:hypothetical protein
MTNRASTPLALAPAPADFLYRGIRQEQSYFISLFFRVRFGFGK